MRIKNVVVAIVHDSAMRFLVCYNRRWKQYAFPMKGTDPGDDQVQAALQALNDHCPYSITEATAKPLEYVGGFGKSWGMGEDTYYNYHVYEVTVDDAANWPVGHVGDWCGFLDYNQLMASPPELLSWSTREIVRALMEGQKVALGVVCRDGASGKEFLLIENSRYHGYFFPVARVKTETEPLDTVLEAVQSDTRYLGRINATYHTDLETQHESPRYNRQRRYRFYLFRITFPGIDLNEPDNAVERTLKAEGITYGWFTEQQLADPAAHRVSSTMAELRLHVSQVCS